MKVRADLIKRALSKRHHEDFYLTEVKTGPTHYGSDLHILDAIAIRKSWANPCVTGYEIKVQRSDFTRDEKWMAYLQYCHQFAFVCPKGLIQPDELPVDVGLVYYNPETGSLHTRRKPVYRHVTIPSNMLMYIIMNRLDSDRHPFFSSKKEYFEALIEDKAERRSLKLMVSKKLKQILEDYENQIRELQWRVDRFETDKRFDEDVKTILKDSGISIGWGWKERLKERLSVGLSGEVKRELDRVKDVIENLEKLIV